MRKLLIAAGGVIATGCVAALAFGWGPFAPGTITTDRLAGAWKGSGGESLEFRKDGTFCAAHFPIERSPEQRVDTCGTWSLSDDHGTDQGIDLDFTTPSYAMMGMVRVSGPEGRNGLYVDWNVDDASDRLELHRES
ncbi:hypothetical protein Shyd_55490 [Streptomyces hydrogenans]|uniref:Lipoprotein n=2 Tax=Streptomyces hydrogenans TaxID=1873719 RepID=A0ABQ3PGN4_9ACTN|nr:hypothetical protein GCM10018784_75050 [Streptomyces hydrogenans]GHI24178.1 hypothetical protein Shyd_55490 [Streptomyces hydrogenans]